jgi:hypothetical protein
MAMLVSGGDGRTNRDLQQSRQATEFRTWIVQTEMAEEGQRFGSSAATPRARGFLVRNAVVESSARRGAKDRCNFTPWF